MSTRKSGFYLRVLGYFGPQKPPSWVTFGLGLNVLYGASNTGKSFVVESIDFMLGGKGPLREVPERVGYDVVLLGFETFDGRSFTITRSIEGGGFRLYEGLHEFPPSVDVEARVLGETHSEKNDENLSAFLLGLCDLSGKRVRKNARGETNSLSFRNIARLMIVDETEITQKRSPLSDGNVVADTTNASTFKLLLTGVDDSSLIASNPRAPEQLSREAQLELLDQLLDDHRGRLRDLTKSPSELAGQMERIDASLLQQATELGTTESQFQKAAAQRRDLRKKLEEGRDRRLEVDALLERFDLLDRHYVSDMARLTAIEEGGSLFSVLDSALCPLCGADPAHQSLSAGCDGNIDGVIDAARKEIEKIQVLRGELALTVDQLRRESTNFDRRLPVVTRELEQIANTVDQHLSPKLSRLRASYSTFADKRGEVREALGLYATVLDMEHRRADLEKVSDDEKVATATSSDLPSDIADSFALAVETILADWNFPEAGRVVFDQKSRDLVVSGKARSAFGKGLRAITHASFSLGLLEVCRTRGTPHGGFLILDSPLLAYREPEGEDDDLRGTDLQERFYAYLKSLPEDRQVFIVENTDPPAGVTGLDQVQMFSKNPHSGRYGLFEQAEASGLLV